MVRDDGELRLLGESSTSVLMMTVTLLAGTEALTTALELPQRQGEVPPVPDHDDHLVLVLDILVHINDL